MRKAMKSVAVVRTLLLSAALFHFTSTPSTSAQGVSPPIDPIIGTWKLNPSATKASPNLPFAAPAQRTEVYTLKDHGQIELVVTTTNANGSTTSSHMMFSAAGGVVTRENAPAGQMLVETRIAPGEWRVTYLTDGVQYLTMQKVVSPDGKIMRQTATGVTPLGVWFEGRIEFQRQ